MNNLVVIVSPEESEEIRPVRLAARTPDFHSGERGSIPLRATNGKNMNIQQHQPIQFSSYEDRDWR